MNRDPIGKGVSRRDLLRYLAMGSAAVAAGPVIAACGGSSGGKSSSSSVAAGNVADITKFVPVDTAHSGKGMTLDMGVVLAFSGPGAFFGRVMSQGVKVASKHIVELGGPTINPIFKDHKSGDPQAGVTAVKELGFSHVPMMLASYVDDLGAMLPGQAQYKIFTMDGGGGTSTFGQGKPYFWGMRAITPNDAVPGTVKYVTDKLTNVKKVQLIGWDLGPLDDPIVKYVNGVVTGAGLQIAGPFIRTKVGATDYSAAIQNAKSNKPDLILLSIYGNDPGYFMKQYVTSGLSAPVVIFEFTADAAKVAGSSYDGVYFAYDYFNAKKPDNGWSSIFINDYKKAYGTDPDFYAANYYEDTFAMWTVIQRALAKGANVKDGTQLDAAMREDLSFKSVYGGDANTAGELVLNPASHSVQKRPMSISQYKGGNVTPLAYFNLNAADYRLA